MDRLESDEATIVFGAGSLASLAIMSSDKEVSIIVDNDPKKQGMDIRTIIGDEARIADSIIRSPDELLKLNVDRKAHIIIASLSPDKIIDQLHTMGYRNLTCINDMLPDIAEKLSKKYDKEDLESNKICIRIGRYGGHGYYITNELLKKDDKIDIVWILRSPLNAVPSRVRCVYDGNIEEMLYELSTAKVWIYDELIPYYINKKKDQVYIQVKHWGSITLKKFYAEENGYLRDENHLRTISHNSRIMDFIFTGSKFDEDSCKKGYLFNGNFIRVGSPRTDALYDKTIKNQVFNSLRLGREDRLLLYIPTYRNHEFDAIYENELNYQGIVEALERKFGYTWKIGIRLHPASIAISKQMKIDDDICLDLSLYENGQELCNAADVVISDYSSMMFEPAIVGKPVFLFAPDRESYVNGERDLLINYDDLPFTISSTSEEVIKNITYFDERKYENSVNAFLNQYGINEDGHASERAADFILSLMK